MDKKHIFFSNAIIGLAGAFGIAAPAVYAGESLKLDLVSYWPLDEVQGNKTPDLASGYDFTLMNMDAADLVAGQKGMAFHFTGARKTHLARTHDFEDDLPANKNESFTISFWAKVDSEGQNDVRLFSEGNNLDGNPLFTLGTRLGDDVNGSVDVFIRNAGDPEITHLRTTTEPLDGVDWRHIVYLQTFSEDSFTATRQLYIDGVLDTLVIPNTEEGHFFDLNITSIGAVVRSSDVAHLTGDIDEVAIWKRALEPSEITDLMNDGIPPLDVVTEPHIINFFTSEFRKVKAGDQVLLSWDGTKDGSFSISPDVGDVTGDGEFGVGSKLVTVNETTEFTITVSRDGEEDLTEVVEVIALPDIEDGWTWIEDFEEYSLDFLGIQGGWIDTEGDYEVFEVGGTQALIQNGGADLSARFLGSHAIEEESSGTLFFRFCYTDEQADLSLNLKMGLTEKAFRFVQDDWGENIGTYLIFSRAGGEELKLQAINGIGGTPIDANMTFKTDVSYDVWIDVENNPLNQTDIFSVHIAELGQPRRTIFDSFESDRAPDNLFLLGPPRPVIDYVFFSSPGLGQASESIAFDDFYMSNGLPFLGTVPVESSFGKVPKKDPNITSFLYNEDTQQVTLIWDTVPGEFYSAFYTTQLDLPFEQWDPSDDGLELEADGESLEYTYPETFDQDKVFFQVRLNDPEEL